MDDVLQLRFEAGVRYAGASSCIHMGRASAYAHGSVRSARASALAHARKQHKLDTHTHKAT